MKRTLFNFKECAMSINFQKLALISTLVFALEISSALNAVAQRRGGGGGGRSSPSMHYSGGSARGGFVNRVPHASTRYYGGHSFYSRGGAFYHPYRSGFIAPRYPFGYRLGFLPRGYLNFYFGGLPYYYYYDTFYVQRDGGYEVVAPPVGAVVESIPSGYEKVEIDGQTYYTVDNVQYKPVMKDGAIWYQVIKSPTKAPESNADKK